MIVAAEVTRLTKIENRTMARHAFWRPTTILVQPQPRYLGCYNYWNVRSNCLMRGVTGESAGVRSFTLA